ncbi:MAG TPA: DedA family protein [Actinotalea sp.]|nr:DedA family protein [Actinotalea sp.]
MVEEWVVALAGSPWVFVALYLAIVIDGFFPPVPSESVVIALASLAVTTGEPDLWVLAVVSAAGAFTGDQVAYTLGRRLSVRDLRIMRGPRQQRGLAWAEDVLAERGAAFIIAARYVPVGRVAVNMTAGAVGYPRRRFSLLAAVAAVSWSVYSIMLGIGAGVWLGEHPLVAVAVGVVLGVLLGLAIDPAIRWVTARGARGVAASRDLDPAPGPVDPDPGPTG